jgi:hypothetical protein
MLRAVPLGATRDRKARDEHLLDQLVGRVRELNGGDLDDDLAMLAVGYPATGQP